MTKPINYVIALAILGVLATLSVILPIYMDDLVYRVLMLSGIGDEKELSEFGIGVTHHAPEVGKNLQDHFMVRYAFRTRPCGTLNEIMANPVRAAGLFHVCRRVDQPSRSFTPSRSSSSSFRVKSMRSREKASTSTLVGGRPIRS